MVPKSEKVLESLFAMITLIWPHVVMMVDDMTLGTALG